MKRSGKFYRRNEAEIMRELGLVPTKNSGSGWIEKEDGQSESVICQLKSTDAQSIKINKLDIEKLEYNASVANKIPVFAVNFLSDNSVYLMVKPEDLQMLAECMQPEFEMRNWKDAVREQIEKELSEEKQEQKAVMQRKIKSSSKQREQFYREKEKKYDKTRKDW